MKTMIPPVMGFSAPSGTGKTTLMAAVIACLTAGGLRVAAIKHGHHPADPDIPGKDTHRFRQAGAETVMFASRERWFLIQDLQDRPEPTLEQQLRLMVGHDLVLVEGYKNDSHPKLVIQRRGVADTGLHERLQNVLAVVSDDAGFKASVPILPLADPEAVAQFIREYLGLPNPLAIDPKGG